MLAIVQVAQTLRLKGLRLFSFRAVDPHTAQLRTSLVIIGFPLRFGLLQFDPSHLRALLRWNLAELTVMGLPWGASPWGSIARGIRRREHR
jgi:hypothetical protein